MTPKLRKEWSDLVKKTKRAQMDKFKAEDQKKALDQNAEEIFSMAYAANYSHHAPMIWCNDDWSNFMKRLEKLQAD